MSELNYLAHVTEQQFANAPASSFLHFVVVSDNLTGERFMPS